MNDQKRFLEIGDLLTRMEQYRAIVTKQPHHWYPNFYPLHLETLILLQKLNYGILAQELESPKKGEKPLSFERYEEILKFVLVELKKEEKK